MTNSELKKKPSLRSFEDTFKKKLQENSGIRSLIWSKQGSPRVRTDRGVYRKKLMYTQGKDEIRKFRKKKFSKNLKNVDLKQVQESANLFKKVKKKMELIKKRDLKIKEYRGFQSKENLTRKTSEMEKYKFLSLIRYNPAMKNINEVERNIIEKFKLAKDVGGMYFIEKPLMKEIDLRKFRIFDLEGYVKGEYE